MTTRHHVLFGNSPEDLQKQQDKHNKHHQHSEAQLLDADTIAGLTGGTAAVVHQENNCSSSSRYHSANDCLRPPPLEAAADDGDAGENVDGDDDMRDARSETLGSIRDSTGSAGSACFEGCSDGVGSVLSDDLGDVYFTDDDDLEAKKDGVSVSTDYLDDQGHSCAIAALTTRDSDSDDGEEVEDEVEGRQKVSEAPTTTAVVQIVAKGHPPSSDGFATSTSAGPAFETRQHLGNGGGSRSRESDSIGQGKTTVIVQDNEEAMTGASGPRPKSLLPSTTVTRRTATSPLLPVSDNDERERQGGQQGEDCERPPTPNLKNMAPADLKGIETATDDDAEDVARITPRTEPLASPHQSRSSVSATKDTATTKSHVMSALSLPSPPPQSYRSAQYSRRGGGGIRAAAVVTNTTRTVQPMPTVTCKVLVVGNAKCGKSSIISRFVSNRFSPDYISTVGADYAMKDVALADGRRVCVYRVSGCVTMVSFRNIILLIFHASNDRNHAKSMFDFCTNHSFNWYKVVIRTCVELVTRAALRRMHTFPTRNSCDMKINVHPTHL